MKTNTNKQDDQDFIKKVAKDLGVKLTYTEIEDIRKKLENKDDEDYYYELKNMLLRYNR